MIASKYPFMFLGYPPIEVSSFIDILIKNTRITHNAVITALYRRIFSGNY